jgi:hypothetical protein
VGIGWNQRERDRRAELHPCLPIDLEIAESRSCPLMQSAAHEKATNIRAHWILQHLRFPAQFPPETAWLRFRRRAAPARQISIAAAVIAQVDAGTSAMTGSRPSATSPSAKAALLRRTTRSLHTYRSGPGRLTGSKSPIAPVRNQIPKTAAVKSPILPLAAARAIVLVCWIGPNARRSSALKARSAAPCFSRIRASQSKLSSKTSKVARRPMNSWNGFLELRANK